MAAPVRRCIACGEHAPKRELQRWAMVGGQAVADPDQQLPGRGAYVHDQQCLRVAIERRAFQRSFRRAVTIIHTPAQS